MDVLIGDLLESVDIFVQCTFLKLFDTLFSGEGAPKHFFFKRGRPEFNWRFLRTIHYLDLKMDALQSWRMRITTNTNHKRFHKGGIKGGKILRTKMWRVLKVAHAHFDWSKVNNWSLRRKDENIDGFKSLITHQKGLNNRR